MSGVSVATNATYASDVFSETSPSRLQTFIKYDASDWVLTVHVKQAECPLHAKHKGKEVYWQIHMTLLPECSQRRKTKYKSTQTPIFNQEFDIPYVPKSAVEQMVVRFRLYGRFKRIGRKKLVGEVEVELSQILHKVGNVIDNEWWTLTNKVKPNRRLSSSSSASAL